MPLITNGLLQYKNVRKASENISNVCDSLSAVDQITPRYSPHPHSSVNKQTLRECVRTRSRIAQHFKRAGGFRTGGLLCFQKQAIENERKLLSYNHMFRADPIAFMRKYSLQPVSDIEGRKGTLDPTEFSPVQNADSTSYMYYQMPKDERFAFLNFEKVPTHSLNQSDKLVQNDRHNQIRVSGSYKADNNKVRSYWLPWQTESVIGISIPKKEVGKNLTPFFFTAGINGCSVIIKGTRQSPTIYHAGGKTQQDNPEDGAAFWRDILETHAATSTANKGPNIAEVNKTHYVLDKVTHEPTTRTPKGVQLYRKVSHGTELSRAYKHWLDYSNADKFTIQDVAPEGCVMGVRAGNGDWTFYLQENVAITYYSIVKKTSKGFFSKTKNENVEVAGSRQTIMRPMQITEIFLGGPGHARFDPTRSTVLKTY